jgi:hypothetical protein
MTAADPDLGAAHGWEKLESGHRRRWREKCTRVEAVLEAMMIEQRQHDGSRVKKTR